MYEGGNGREKLFDRGFLGTRLGNLMPLPRLFGRILKMVARPIVVIFVIFKRVWLLYELDIEGLKPAQRNELVVPRQKIAFSSKRRLIRMSATDK